MAMKFLILSLMIFQCLFKLTFAVNENKPLDCQYDIKICIDCECSCEPVSLSGHLGSEQGLKIVCDNKSIGLSSLEGKFLPAIRELKHNFTFLDFSVNKLEKIPPGIFQGLENVIELGLRQNQLTSLHKNSFAGLTSLVAIILDKNGFQEFPTNALLHHDLSSLRQIYMDGMLIQTLPGEHFHRLHQLETLWLQNNQILEIPTMALSHLTLLRELKLSDNQISDIPPLSFANNSRLSSLWLRGNYIRYIPNNAFVGLHMLVYLHLEGNPIANIGIYAFNNLPSLEEIKILHAQSLPAVPTLSGTVSLKDLTLENCNISSVPTDFCMHKDNLQGLYLGENKIEAIPSLIGCVKLVTLNLRSNLIRFIGNYSFEGLDNMWDLVLKANLIEYIPEMAFYGLHGLQHLDMSHNKIKFIHENAFLPLENLQELNLAYNQFKYLPSAGLSSVRKLYTAHNLELQNIPPPEALPMVTKIKTSYAYHCCQYSDPHRQRENTTLTDYIWLKTENEDDYYFNQSFAASDYYIGNGSTFFAIFSYIMSDSLVELNYDYEVSWIWSSSEDSTEDEDNEVTCHPEPGPFVPCDDIFESWFLRLGVWMVLILALFGNTMVLFVNIFSKTKMDVSRFLICNLACADFMMGLYLSILALADVTTLGEFRRFGVEWQRGAACQIIGFLGVLSSELSIYTLSVITLERFYTLKYALYSKRLKLRGAVIIMAFGWLFAITLATLPLCGIGKYITVVCLPIHVKEKPVMIAVLFVLLLNAASFIILMCCYASIYYSIQGSSAWNSQDSLIAKRMSILVFTDLACWAPIAFFAISTAFDFHPISLSTAKFLTIFVLPLNSCANPFLYTLLTKQFKADCKAIARKICGTVCRRKHPRPSITIGNIAHGHENFDKVMPLNGNGFLQRYGNMPVSGGERGHVDFEDGCPTYPPPPLYETPENGAMVKEIDSHGNYLDGLTGLDLDHIRRGSGSPLLERHEGSFQPSQLSSGKVKPKKKKFMIPFLSWRGDHRFSKGYTNKDWDGSSLRNNKQLVRRSLSMTEGMLAAKPSGSPDLTQNPKPDSSTTPELSSSDGKSAGLDLSFSQYPAMGQGQRSSISQSQTPQRSPEHRSNRSPVHLWIPRSPLSKKPKVVAVGNDLTTNSENTTEFSLTEFEQEMDLSQKADVDHLPTDNDDLAEPTASLLQKNNNSVNLMQESSPEGSFKLVGENPESEVSSTNNVSSTLERLQEDRVVDVSESSDKLLGQVELAPSSKKPKESLV